MTTGCERMTWKQHAARLSVTSNPDCDPPGGITPRIWPPENVPHTHCQPPPPMAPFPGSNQYWGPTRRSVWQVSPGAWFVTGMKVAPPITSVVEELITVNE